MGKGKLIVFEMLTDDSELSAFSYSYDGGKIRRLTDEEVEGLLISQEILKTHSRTVGAIWWDDIAMKWQSAPQPADDERGRFVRETAARMLPYCAERYSGPDWEEKAVSACIKHAESLAARVFGEKTK